MKKALPTKKEHSHKHFRWCTTNLGSRNVSINDGMFPFLLPMGKEVLIPESDPPLQALRLQYCQMNHNKISPNTALEIANNLAGDPMKFESGPDAVMYKDLTLIFYQSNEVRLFCIWIF